jgi:small-conductance mechanosensitive channel
MRQHVSWLFGELTEPGTLVGALFYLVVVLAIAMLIARTLRAGVRRVLARDVHGVIDRTAASYLTQIAQITVYVLALTFYTHLVPALQHVGTALLAGVSIASVVVGLAAQSTLGNLIAGLSLLLYRPFRIDDLLQISTPGGAEVGVVEGLTLGYTLLRTTDDRRIVVPNSAMVSQVAVNVNARRLRAMMIVPFGMIDATRAEEARERLLEIARAHPRVLRVIGCLIRLRSDGGADLSLRAWCADTDAATQAAADLVAEGRSRLAQEGIAVLVAAG